MTDIIFDTYKNTFRELSIADAKKGVKANLTSFIIINAILVTINLTTNPTNLWCLGSLIGWGIGVIAHYIGGVAILEKKMIRMEGEAKTLAEEKELE